MYNKVVPTCLPFYITHFNVNFTRLVTGIALNRSINIFKYNLIERSRLCINRNDFLNRILSIS